VVATHNKDISLMNSSKFHHNYREKFNSLGLVTNSGYLQEKGRHGEITTSAVASACSLPTCSSRSRSVKPRRPQWGQVYDWCWSELTDSPP